jgi:hypothetical protein
MHMTAFVFASVAWMLLTSGHAFAQEWDLYVNTQDGFKVNFPGRPRITEITWKSQFDYTLPGRVYSAEKGSERYSVTVVDYTGLEQQGIERSRTCPPGNAQCRAEAGPAIGPGYWKHDAHGAIVYATFKLLQRDARLTNLSWDWQDLVEGQTVHLTNNGDESRTFAHVAMHQNKLYIVEGTTPKGYPEPGLFQQSMGWVDKDGNGIRYQTVYSNVFHGMGVHPAPPVVAAAPVGR